MMSPALRFRILNVFALDGDPFSGNPLCVFEDGRALSDAQMQSLARQLNLSETTFVLPSEREGATARVRIFTPSFEMPFAGHPTLGTAHVVRSLRGSREDALVLDMKAGLVEVKREARGAGGALDRWTLRTARAPESRAPSATRVELTSMLGLPRGADALAGEPLWVDTGAEQLVIPLASADLVRAARPNAELLQAHGFSEKRGAAMAYAWAPLAEGDVLARFFFLVNGGVVEDPATGSACANLGGWHLATKKPLPVRLRVSQGEAIARPSRLDLHVDADERIFVGGAVREVASGTFDVGSEQEVSVTA